jgi:hypothetical protein
MLLPTNLTNSTQQLQSTEHTACSSNAFIYNTINMPFRRLVHAPTAWRLLGEANP